MITDQQFADAENEIAVLLNTSRGQCVSDRDACGQLSTASATRITRAIAAARAEAAAARRIGRIMARVQSESGDYSHLQ